MKKIIFFMFLFFGFSFQAYSAEILLGTANQPFIIPSYGNEQIKTLELSNPGAPSGNRFFRVRSVDGLTLNTGSSPDSPFQNISALQPISMINLNNGKFFILSKFGSSFISPIVFDTINNTTDIIDFRREWQSGLNTNIASGVDANEDYVLFNSGGFCYNVTNNNYTCDISNINIAGSSFKTINGNNPENNEFYSPTWEAGLLTWADGSGRIIFNGWDPGNFITIENTLSTSGFDSLFDLITNNTIQSQHVKIEVVDFDENLNQVQFYISFDNYETINVFVDFDNGVASEEFIGNQQYIAHFDGQNITTVLATNPNGIYSTECRVRLYDARCDIGFFNQSGTMRIVYYKDGVGWVYQTDETPIIGVGPNSPGAGGSTGVGDPGNNTGSGSFDSSVFNFDIDGDGEVGLLNGEFFIGISNIFKGFFESIFNFFSNIGDLISKLGELFTTEVKDFSFINSTYAENEIAGLWNGIDENGFDDSTVGKFYNFFIAFMVFLIILISILLLTYKGRKND